MAVIQKNKADKVIIQVDVSDTATPDYRNRTISKITPTITDDVAYQVGTRLGSLQADTIHAIKRSITYDMANGD